MSSWPKNKERRLVQRLLNIWRDAQPDEKMPSLERVFLRDFGDIVMHTIVLEVATGVGKPRFACIGKAFDGEASPKLIGQSISEAPPGTLLLHAVSEYERTLTRRVPIISEGSFVLRPGDLMLYRSIALPMSDDGATINAILCAANGKIVPDDAD